MYVDLLDKDAQQIGFRGMASRDPVDHHDDATLDRPQAVCPRSRPRCCHDCISAARQLIAVAEYPVGAEVLGDRGTLVIARRGPHLEANSTTHLNERSRHAARSALHQQGRRTQRSYSAVDRGTLANFHHVSHMSQRATRAGSRRNGVRQPEARRRCVPADG